MKAEEISARIDVLQAEVQKLEQEMRIVQGRLKNLDPAVLKTLQEENQKQTTRTELLIRAIEYCSLYLIHPKQAEDLEMENQSLRAAAIELFKKENVTPELWKNLESSS